jgi:hypothetical protein
VEYSSSFKTENPRISDTERQLKFAVSFHRRIFLKYLESNLNHSLKSWQLDHKFEALSTFVGGGSQQFFSLLLIAELFFEHLRHS